MAVRNSAGTREKSKMHAALRFYIATVKAEFPEFFDNVSVLEIGSFDVNGSVREYFSRVKEFVGVDVIAGKGADIVAQGQEVTFDRQFDVVVSTECFEHNPYYKETFVNMVRHTRSGGLVIFSCASTGRPEHGTSRAGPHDSPGTVALGWEYYKNLEADDFSGLALNEQFEGWHFFYNQEKHDLYFLGIKKSVEAKNWNMRFDKIAAAILSAHNQISRTAKCPCGSGQRYKHCHGQL